VVATAAERPQGSSASAVPRKDENRVDCHGVSATALRSQSRVDKSGGQGFEKPGSLPAENRQGHVHERGKMSKLRLERRVLELLNDTQMRTLIGFKPRTFREARLHLNGLLVLDTGLRISEALQSRHADVDYDNLILKVMGKGRTSTRMTPLSIAEGQPSGVDANRLHAASRMSQLRNECVDLQPWPQRSPCSHPPR
jgi:hypothetical protein